MAKKMATKENLGIFLVLGISFLPLGFTFLIKDPGMGIPFLVMSVVFMLIGLSDRKDKKKKK